MYHTCRGSINLDQLVELLELLDSEEEVMRPLKHISAGFCCPENVALVCSDVGSTVRQRCVKINSYRDDKRRQCLCEVRFQCMLFRDRGLRAFLGDMCDACGGLCVSCSAADMRRTEAMKRDPSSRSQSRSRPTSTPSSVRFTSAHHGHNLSNCDPPSRLLVAAFFSCTSPNGERTVGSSKL